MSELNKRYSVDTEGFIRAFKNLQKAALANARDKNWDTDNDGEQLALIHSEVSECLEALRKGNPPDRKIPEFNGGEAELADVVVRILTYSAARDWRVGEAIIAKMIFNMTPKAKEDAEGKAF